MPTITRKRDGLRILIPAREPNILPKSSLTFSPALTTSAVFGRPVKQEIKQYRDCINMKPRGQRQILSKIGTLLPKYQLSI